MAICHVVRCDGPECQAEKPLSTMKEPMGLPSHLPPIYFVPDDWLQVDGHEFCSWRCVTQFGMSQLEDTQGVRGASLGLPGAMTLQRATDG
mgnify:CR=1 FL=1